MKKKLLPKKLIILTYKTELSHKFVYFILRVFYVLTLERRRKKKKMRHKLVCNYNSPIVRSLSKNYSIATKKDEKDEEKKTDLINSN